MVYRKPDSGDSENALRPSGDRRKLLLLLACDAVGQIAITLLVIFCNAIAFLFAIRYKIEENSLKRLSIASIPFLMLAVFALQANARPEYRFDDNSQTCRDLKDGQLEWDSRGYGEGGQIFKNLCKSCHFRGNDKDAPFLWTESKTSQAWNRVFTQRYPKCAKNGAWDSATAEQLRKVNDYLYRFSENSRDMFDNC